MRVVRAQKVIAAALPFFLSALASAAQDDPCLRRSIPITVRDERENLISDLTPEEFKGEIKGKPVQIISVRPDESPRRVVVVLDSSGSMVAPAPKWDLAKFVASDAVTGSPARYLSGFILFNDQVRMKFPVQADPQPFRDAFRDLRAPVDELKKRKLATGLTALRDALLAAAELLDPPAFGDSIYLVSDGTDNKSKTEPQELRGRFARQGTRLYVMLFRDAEGARATVEEMEGPIAAAQLASDSGGFALAVPASGIRPWSHDLDSKSMKQLQVEIATLYSAISSPQRLEIVLPAPVTKLQNWKLTVHPPKRQKAYWQVSYPKYLDVCPASAPTTK